MSNTQPSRAGDDGALLPGDQAPSAHRARRERSIVQSARRNFALRGFDRTSVAEIAREVGVVEGTIYTYFDSKRALLHRVIAEFYGPLIAEAETSLQGVKGSRNQIRYLIWRQLRAFVEEPELCYLIIRELQPTADSYDSVVVGLARRYTMMAVRVVEDGIQAGEISPEISPMTVRAMIYGSVENLAWRLTFRGKPIDVEQVADELTAVLFRGVERRPGAESEPDTASLGALIGEMRDFLAEARTAGRRPKISGRTN